MFVDTTFPQGLMPYFTKEIEYITNVNVASSGLEFRRLINLQNNVVYKLYTAIKKSEDIEILQNFFNIMQGKTCSFKLYDETECKIEKSSALIVGKHTAQMQKVVQTGEQIFTQNITKPKFGTVKIYNDAVEITSGFEINWQTGEITFAEDISNAKIYVSANYFKHVRFNVDTISIKQKGFGSFEVENVALKTVIN